MIVIEGRNEKSRVLENLIRKEFMTDNVAILDAKEGNKVWSDADWATVYRTKNEPIEVLIEGFKKNYAMFSLYDWIVFYVNADKDTIDKFKELDRKYPQNFIVTIQSDNGITSKYFI